MKSLRIHLHLASIRVLGNMKESWKTDNELLNKRPKSCNSDCLKDAERTFVNNKAISNAMNNFFCTIGEKLASKIDAALSPFLSGETNSFQFSSL